MACDKSGEKMKLNKNYLVVFLISMLLMSCTDTTSENLPPKITAQGFTIDDVQEGVVGSFGALKIRFESVGRIEKLYIKERSYEVDLATTPERSYFGLFGIQKKTSLRKDVTLDFQNYINQKLNQPGQYIFNIEVVDKKGKSSKAILKVRIIEPKDKSAKIETGRFQLQRHGRSSVTNSETFGITWKTIDKIKVTVRVTKKESGASKLARFNMTDYEQLTSKKTLSEKMSAADDVNEIVFNTANNAAKAQVLGVSMQGKHYMLKTEKSYTTLAQVGTIVTLNGEYKF